MFETQYFLGEERRKELVNQAQQYRLAREVLEGGAEDREKGSSIYRLALARIGLGLIALGTPLKERNGATPAMQVDAR